MEISGTNGEDGAAQGTIPSGAAGTRQDAVCGGGPEDLTACSGPRLLYSTKKILSARNKIRAWFTVLHLSGTFVYSRTTTREYRIARAVACRGDRV